MSWLHLFAPRKGCRLPRWTYTLGGRKFRTLALQLRNPLALVSSRAARRPRASLRWITCNTGQVWNRTADALAEALAHTVDWLGFAFAVADRAFRVEVALDGFGDLGVGGLRGNRANLGLGLEEAAGGSHQEQKSHFTHQI